MEHSPQSLVTASKFLSLVLRHKPQTIGLTLDPAGWADVNELLLKAAQHKRPLPLELLQTVVETSDKKRFAFSSDGSKIRANQGHSIDVELGLPAANPPAVLYHGTAQRFLDSILAQGLTKQQRHHVHLTEDQATAVAVGSRYGHPVLLAIDARCMAEDGRVFFLAANGVWLTEQVPSSYVSVLG
ncbi:RNA 2'-phosphotransferase [Acidovorax sp.]|uniref:RNA 2'-phosphotransferase n=1 Tax=Acidovorax sp. TaxID=1872122 RepID=UPI00261A6F6F|nr:RNA 2'-phosphotransferase [Acidovorax sp.]